ncbi:hypothetical protein Cde04nite_25850 [Cellulomonas denverensis]|nr:hypothetical protein Cde04nite_25850 [Cellulomonas denverensis]
MNLMTRVRPALSTRAVGGAAIAMLGALTLTGCWVGHPEQASMAITNNTDEPLAIRADDTPPRYTIRPGESLGFGLPGAPGDCTQWTLHATTVDGVEASSFGEPLCDDDHWTISQSALVGARSAAGMPSPSPSPSADL